MASLLPHLHPCIRLQRQRPVCGHKQRIFHHPIAARGSGADLAGQQRQAGATVTGATQTFKWQQVTGATGYVLELQDVTAGTGVKRYTISSGSTTSYQLKLTAGHSYKWEVFAYDGAIHGLPSTEFLFKTHA